MAQIRTVDMKITGISALLMHRYPLEPIEAIEKLSKEEQAEIASYRDDESGELYIPAIAVQRALIAGATYSKGKGRATLQKPVAACVLVTPEKLLLGIEDYTIDSRRVVVPSTKGSVVRHRPRLDEWSCELQCEFDPTLITEDQIRRVFDDTGTRVGLLDFRPSCKGPYGRFRVDSWSRSEKGK